MAKHYKYKAFISYAHRDKAFAEWLHKKIERYRIPKSLRKIYPHLPKTLKRTIFRDEEELAGTSDLSATLKIVLQDSEKLIVICSSASVASQWVEKEILYFKTFSSEEKILSVLKQGDPEEILPKVLQGEPLAIDMKKKRKNQLLKVIATLLEVDFADLWLREVREARKRFVLGSLAVITFIFMTIYLYVQSVAISSNTALEKINKEILVLTYESKKLDLSEEKRYQIGQRLKILEETKQAKEQTLKWFGMLKSSLVTKAQEVYNQEGAQSALVILESIESHAEDERYAKKNILRAKLYIEIGAYEEADRFYKKAVLVDDAYENVYDYALFLMKQNQLTKAKRFFDKLKNYKLSELERASVLNRLGIIYRQSKQFQKAQKVYQEALVLREKLSRQNPKRYKNDLAWTYNNLGILYQHNQQFGLAEKNHLKALELRKALMQEQGDQYHYVVSCSMHNLGELYRRSNHIEKAERYLHEVLEIRRVLFKQNPKKLTAPLASTLHQLATLYDHVNKVQASEKIYIEALTLRRLLVKNNPEAYKFVLADTLTALVKLYRKIGKPENANRLQNELKLLEIGERHET